MKSIFITSILLLIYHFTGFSQMEYSKKIETGYLIFQYTTIQVDPGSNWKGYNLNNEQNGVDINLINGIKLKEKYFAGIGIGYLNFEGINGFSVFSDFEYCPLKTKLTPLLNLKIGYNHIWNQYENGTGSAIGELGAGVKYKLSDKIGIFIQSGFLMTQQSFLIPIRIGVSF